MPSRPSSCLASAAVYRSSRSCLFRRTCAATASSIACCSSSADVPSARPPVSRRTSRSPPNPARGAPPPPAGLETHQPLAELVGRAAGQGGDGLLVAQHEHQLGAL